MLQIIYFTLTLVTAIIVLSFAKKIGTSSEAFMVTGLLTLAFFSIWGGCIISSIKDCLVSQLEDMNDLRKYRAKKNSFTTEMEEYKSEMQKPMLDKYREFEETIMTSVKDSKIIMAALKKSGYADMVQRYENRITSFLSNINGCDRSCADAVASMLSRQDNTLLGYAKFIPQRLYYEETK